MRGSLSVIKREIKNEFKNKLGSGSDLDSDEWRTLKHWIKSGVFLLNTALTVEIDKPSSHLKLKIWENFTKEVIEYISKYMSENQPCIWMLWGEDAQSFE